MLMRIHRKQIEAFGDTTKVVQACPKEVVAPDFDLTLEVLIEEFLPLGIKSFQGELTNDRIRFKLTVTGKGIEDWSLNIKKNDTVVYSCYSSTKELSDVIVTASRPKSKKNAGKTPPPAQSAKVKRFWPAGVYIIDWDGFDTNQIYDSTDFIESTFVAEIEGQANGQRQSASTTPFSFEYVEVKWVDLRVDRAAHKIDTTLRVDLQDGGALGTECTTQVIGTDGTVDECPWDRVPESVIARENNRPPLHAPSRGFADLKQLALNGLRYHWSRNKGHAEAPTVKIATDEFEIFVEPVDTTTHSMDDINLVFNTNGSWLRSGNPGSLAQNPISWFANVLPERIAYNAGYIDFSDWNEKSAWRYVTEASEDIEFAYTAAHEIGHEILKSYGTTAYSYGHKDTSTVVTQSTKDTAPACPAAGEIDLMKYYKYSPLTSQIKRIVAAEVDVLGLLWLSKLRVKH